MQNNIIRSILTLALSLRVADKLKFTKTPVSEGEWTVKHDITIIFNFTDGHYLLVSSGKHWTVRELLRNGSIGYITDAGLWPMHFITGYHFPNDLKDGKQFMYLIGQFSLFWGIYELLPGGKVGNMTEYAVGAGTIKEKPATLFVPYAVDNKHYVINILMDNHTLYIRELNSNGTWGSITSKNTLKYDYTHAFTYTDWRYQYLCIVSKNLADRQTWILKLLPNGELGKHTTSTNWPNQKFTDVFAFRFRNQNIVYGLTPKSNVLLGDILPDGKFSKFVHPGKWGYLPKLYPYNIKGRQFFYQVKNSYYWLITEMYYDEGTAPAEGPYR